jgi:hypothetical protein
MNKAQIYIYIYIFLSIYKEVIYGKKKYIYIYIYKIDKKGGIGSIGLIYLRKQKLEFPV